MGVPKAVDPWVNHISTVVTILIDDIIENDQWESIEIDWEGKEYPLYKGSLIMTGENFSKTITDSFYGGDVKKLLNSEEFKNFPLYNPQINVDVVIIPDVIYDDQQGDTNRMEATHSFLGDDVGSIKLGNLGKHKIFSKNNFIFKVVLPASYISNRTNKHQTNLFNSLLPTVGHELTHSYQTYMQLLGGKKSIGFGRETILNMLPQTLKFNDTPSWNYFLHTIYLSLSFEVNARVTELYYNMKRKGVKSNDEALQVLLKSDPWDDYKKLKEFNADKFIKQFDSEIPEVDPIQQLISQLTGVEPEPVVKKLINMWDHMIQDAQEKIKSIGIDIPFMEQVPKSAKDNPILFFKFFEKRFHKRAEQLKKKLTKIVSLVVQEAE